MNERTKELDGLRGIAVILVMALHIFKRASLFTANPTLHFITSLTSVGWVGVDIFFVLSGFLITSILLKTKEKKDYFKNFYMRRALRIFPLYFVCVAVILYFIPVLDGVFVPEVPRVIPFLLLYQQNWINILGGDLWMTLYLSVTWSLAIEEQFYLVWPAIVFFSRKETLLRISIGIIAASILARIIGVFFWGDIGQVTNFFFYNTFTRFEQLVFGALLAMAFIHADWRERLRRISLPVFLLFLIIFLGLCLASLPGVPHPIYNNYPLTLAGYTVSSVFTAALIAYLMSNENSTMLHVFFRNRILVFFGKHSYAMYLIHMPIALIFMEFFWKNGYRGWQIYVEYVALAFGVTILISFITWHVFEKHMLNLKKYFEYQ
jgi:peptidoglycan/LPS O-acetylase OafA/YrhL